jgi:hypothetical protein
MPPLETFAISFSFFQLNSDDSEFFFFIALAHVGPFFVEAKFDSVAEIQDILPLSFQIVEPRVCLDTGNR